MTATPITFSKLTNCDGEYECWILRGNETVGTLSRARPVVWGARLDLVRDRSKPWEYVAEIDGREVTIPDGSTLREAKALVRSAA